MNTPDVFAGTATYVVFAGGPPPTPAQRSLLTERLAGAGVVRAVAADSGIALADALGVGSPQGPALDAVLGDMDSVDPDRLERAVAEGVAVERFPSDKDATDLELALDDVAAHAAPGDRLLVVASSAGRFDHVLAIVTTLAAPVYEPFVREAWLGAETVHVVTASRSLDLAAGTTFSVLPVNGDAHGVTARNVRWELHAESLPAGTSRGVSNVAVGAGVEIEVADGTVLVVVPSDQGPHEDDERRQDDAEEAR
jgi:thiamine pyrophosphokinase